MMKMMKMIKDYIKVLMMNRHIYFFYYYISRKYYKNIKKIYFIYDK